jgi:hypothetical protein
MRIRRIAPFVTLLCLLSLFVTSRRPATAQAPAPLMAQDTDRSPVRPLTPAKRDALGDPLFELVLKDHADTTSLDAVENLLQPDRTKRLVFVVDETIADSRRNPHQPQSRRTVLTYEGMNPSLPGVSLEFNVMLSVFLTETQFPDPMPIEAWGWDTVRKRYNFYKLDPISDGNPKLTWRFRGSSDGKDSFSETQRRDTCFRCHVNGAPVMKELLFPWNNWHSVASAATYLRTTGPTPPWPVAASNRLARPAGSAGGLSQAEKLEGLIIRSIHRFNTSRMQARFPLGMDGAVPKTDANGFAQVDQARRLLRPLFVTTEFNLISSKTKSGLHPIPAPNNQGPGAPVPIPPSLLLNANLIGGGGVTGYQSFSMSAALFADLPPTVAADYKQLVQQSGVKIGGTPGDADFAWFVPEPSHVDNDMIDQLVRAGVVTRQFVAAVLAVDLENPVFSKDREMLLAFVPDQFRFKPATPASHPDELTMHVIAALQAAGAPAGSPQQTFLQLLQDPDPVAKLQARVEAYRDRVKGALDNPQTRTTELRRLQQKVIAARRAILADRVLKNLDEFGNLLPLP